MPETSDSAQTNRQKEVTQLDRAFRRIAQVAKNAEQRDALWRELGMLILAESSLGLVFQLSSHVDSPSLPQLQVLASRYSQVPDNVESWAISLGIKGCVSSQSQRDQAIDADGQAVHLIAVPIVSTDEQQEAIIGMYVDHQATQFLEMALLQFAANTIKSWDNRQQTTDFRAAAEDLAAITELVARVESTDSLTGACQCLANEVAQYCDLLASDRDERRVRAFRAGKPKQDPTGQEGIAGTDAYVAWNDTKGHLRLAAISRMSTIPANTPLADFRRRCNARVCRTTSSICLASQQR